jgi:hypothetical protein
VTASVAKERVEILRLAARVEWAAGRRRRALGYWRRAIAEGERLGARPELARTWMELGHRLGAETLDGVDGPAGCAARRRTFAALELDWDLAHLRGARARTRRPARRRGRLMARPLRVVLVKPSKYGARRARRALHARLHAEQHAAAPREPDAGARRRAPRRVHTVDEYVETDLGYLAC